VSAAKSRGKESNRTLRREESTRLPVFEKRKERRADFKKKDFRRQEIENIKLRKKQCLAGKPGRRQEKGGGGELCP